MKNKRPTMEEIYMHLAIELSERSKCSKAKVGCVIATKDLRKIIGLGYNGYAKKIDYTCIEEICYCLHAENNAITSSGSEYTDKVFFVTMMPCFPCTIQIINSGCSKLYYHSDYKKGSRHWANYDIIRLLLKRSKIIIKKI